MAREQSLFRGDGPFARGVGLAGCLAVILGAKLWLIATYGSSTPFWDQWSEAQGVYRPFLTGTLSLADLLAAHNEHRIILTRLVALALFVAEGRWDPIGLTIVNAVIHTAALGLLIVMLSRLLDVASALLLSVFAALLFALPFGWMNTLVGFQTQFYLLVLLAPLSLWTLYASAAWTPRWWLGTLLGVLSYFSIASGALTLPAFIAIAGIEFAIGRRAGPRELSGLLVHAILAAAMIWDIPKISAHAGFAPRSILDWYEWLSVAASWPVAKSSWPSILRVLTAGAIYAPTVVLAVRLLRQRAPISDGRWLLLTIACWAILQTLALVQGRGAAALQSRYYDLLLIGVLVNAATLLHLQCDDISSRWRNAVTFACAAWLTAITIGLGQKAFDGIPAELAWRRETTQAQTDNLTRFLATGDFAALANKPEFYIPYPSAEYLRDVTTDPVIRAILPPELLGEPAPGGFRRFVVKYGALLIPIGISLFMTAGLALSRRRDAAC